MATLPEAQEPVGEARIWATFREPGDADRSIRALVEAGVDRGRITVAEDPGSTEGPVGHEREHREGRRIGGRIVGGAALGAAVGVLLGLVAGLVTDAGSTGYALWTVSGALFLGGVGGFVAGLSALGAATADHRPIDDAPGRTAIEVRADGDLADRAITALRRQHPETLVVTDALGRPRRELDTGTPPRRGRS